MLDASAGPERAATDPVAMLRAIYPAISESEAEMVVAIERDYPRWHVFPMVGYPQNHIWYARRRDSDVEPLRRHGLAEIPRGIEDWEKENNTPRWRFV
ncbi:MAG TPA: hypothetical protein VMV92_05090 [Streptosporangiaceae bacterium]|nr:hypothetical protein [Streptosporangiaceae bacterium]